MQSLSFGVKQWSEAREDMREWTGEGVSRWAMNANHQNQSETSFNDNQLLESHGEFKSSFNTVSAAINIREKLGSHPF